MEHNSAQRVCQQNNSRVARGPLQKVLAVLRLRSDRCDHAKAGKGEHNDATTMMLPIHRTYDRVNAKPDEGDPPPPTFRISRAGPPGETVAATRLVRLWNSLPSVYTGESGSTARKTAVSRCWNGLSKPERQSARKSTTRRKERRPDRTK